MTNTQTRYFQHSTDPSRRNRFPAIAIAVAGFCLFASTSPAIDIKATGNPVVTGTGAAMTARWSNVGQVNGKSIDLFLQVLSYTGTPKWVMVTESNDFKFQFTNGVKGETRTATLKWTFYKGGTNTPATVPSLAFTVDDLDDGARRESLSTTDAYDYTVNTPTGLVHSKVGGKVSAAGSGNIEYNSGDPKAAVKLLFTDKSSIVITYQTIFNGQTLSAYHHDGNGDFVFDQPPVKLYYTFDLINRETYALPVSFTNTLPEGLFWDSEYMELSGKLTGNSIGFSDENRTASAKNIVMHPGTNRLTLRTLETSKKGLIQNTATMDPKHPYLAPIVHTSSITLP